MRTVGLVTALLLGALATPALAEYVTYNEWRHEKQSIGEVVDAMPNSDLNGSLNRISALLDRSAVERLAPGDANEGLLPNNWDEQMLRALEDLRADWKAVVGELTLEQKLTMLQVFDVVVISRNAELWQGWDAYPCIPTPEHPCTVALSPPIIFSVDGLVSGLRSEMNAMISAYNTERGAREPLIDTGLDSGNFDAELDRIRATFLTIGGVESIDD